MRIFCPAWGETHTGLLFQKAMGNSLTWMKNNHAVKGAKWIVPTDSEENGRRLVDFVENRIDPDVVVDLIVIPEIVKQTHHHGRMLLTALLSAMEECIQEKDSFLMSCPDYIWGEGTIENLQIIGSDENSVVSAAHIRALPEILQFIDDGPLTNCALIGYAFDYAHETWIRSRHDHEEDGTTVMGGIHWKWINAWQAAVKHYLPAPFYANFQKEDLEFFKTTFGHEHDHTFAMWDHAWPARLLDQGRLRVVGSTDAVCMVEVTHKDMNIPKPNPPGTTNKNDYFRGGYHNHIHKQFVTIFRGQN